MQLPAHTICAPLLTVCILMIDTALLRTHKTSMSPEADTVHLPVSHDMGTPMITCVHLVLQQVMQQKGCDCNTL